MPSSVHIPRSYSFSTPGLQLSFSSHYKPSQWKKNEPGTCQGKWQVETFTLFHAQPKKQITFTHGPDHPWIHSKQTSDCCFQVDQSSILWTTPRLKTAFYAWPNVPNSVKTTKTCFCFCNSIALSSNWPYTLTPFILLNSLKKQSLQSL